MVVLLSKPLPSETSLILVNLPTWQPRLLGHAAGLWHIDTTFGFNMNTNDEPCSFQLYHNGGEVWYFTT